MCNKKFIIWIMIVIAATVLVISGDYEDNMRKGSGICWECIGFE